MPAELRGASFDVDDHIIVTVGWTDLAESLADDPLVRPDARKRKARERRTAQDDLDFCDARVGRRLANRIAAVTNTATTPERKNQRTRRAL